MIISIASGKGGTGKTTVAVNLARVLNENTLLLDCDVEEPNCHIFLKPEITDYKKLKNTIWLDWWTKYYVKGPDDPDYTLLVLNPKQARFYYKLNLVNFEL